MMDEHIVRQAGTSKTVTVDGGEVITENIASATPKHDKLIIELTNLGEGNMRTVKRELKVVIEDWAWKKMISGCVRVKEV